MMQITMIKLALAIVCVVVLLITSGEAARELLDYDDCHRGYGTSPNVLERKAVHFLSHIGDCRWGPSSIG